MIGSPVDDRDRDRDRALPLHAAAEPLHLVYPAPRAGVHVAAQPRASYAPLDETDQLILRLLQADGRITMRKLALRAGLSVAATRRRVRRFVVEARILGFHAVLDAEKLRTGTLAFTHVRLDHSNAGAASLLRAAVDRCEEILGCWEVAGDFDLLIKTRTADVGAYRALLSALIWRLPAVRETRSYVVVEVVKSASPLPLEAI
jgi:Lrp/AsnC family leucine-responsive transcriptional regulator